MLFKCGKAILVTLFTFIILFTIVTYQSKNIKISLVEVFRLAFLLTFLSNNVFSHSTVDKLQSNLVQLTDYAIHVSFALSY